MRLLGFRHSKLLQTSTGLHYLHEKWRKFGTHPTSFKIPYWNIIHSYRGLDLQYTQRDRDLIILKGCVTIMSRKKSQLMDQWDVLVVELATLIWIAKTWILQLWIRKVQQTLHPQSAVQDHQVLKRNHQFILFLESHDDDYGLIIYRPRSHKVDTVQSPLCLWEKP